MTDRSQSRAAYVLPPSALPSRKRYRAWGCVAAVLLFLAIAFRILEVNPLLLFTDFHFIVDLLGEMLPPALDLLWTRGGIWSSIGVTFAMAFLGTVVGALLAFVLAFLAARNTSPVPWLRTPFRILLGAQRAAPDFAIMLVIVVAVGFGPFAGTLALIIGSTGMFGKLFADAVEQIDPRVTEGLSAAGASRANALLWLATALAARSRSACSAAAAWASICISPTRRSTIRKCWHTSWSSWRW